MAAPDEHGWLLIETAPKDGSKFLAFGSYVYEGDSVPTTYIEIISYSGDSGWPWSNGQERARGDVFTHWQPLPKPPVGA